MTSHVPMEQHQCMVCGNVFDTGVVLMDKRLKKSMKMHTVTGMGLCPAHQKLFDDGYIALVECDETKSTPHGIKLDSKDAFRTGTIAHIRRTTAKQAFNIPISEHPMVFVERGVIEALRGLTRRVVHAKEVEN